MLEFKPIELSDKGKIDIFLNEWLFESSEIHFSNLFLWQKSWDIRYDIKNGFLFIALDREAREMMFAPISIKKGMDIAAAMREAERYFAGIGQPLSICCVTDELLEQAAGCCSADIEIAIDRNNFDYIYLTEDLSKLQGKKYHSKRNQVKSFMENHRYEYSTLEKEHANGCLELCEKWVRSKNGSMLHLEEECEAVCRALTNMDTLGFTGCVILIDELVEAFSIGEQIRPDMAVIHFEKANAEIKGLYAAVNMLFAQNRWRGVKYINREEDMGIGGLRRSKLSYHPVKMIQKYSITGAGANGS
ncbi:MAG: phosphatidylglycerol lysyltransferase domain-containing protein [Bacillota bacterium]|nr:phosphatidylglycerol lysyltransferase domain-containing protein [Bacillota bacterium]